MPKNDFRSYQAAVREYRDSDSLEHSGKKGMKWGISTTPGYVAIGEKAKALLNNTVSAFKSIGSKISGKTSSPLSSGANMAKSKAVSIADIAEQRRAEARAADAKIKAEQAQKASNIADIAERRKAEARAADEKIKENDRQKTAEVMRKHGSDKAEGGYFLDKVQKQKVAAEKALKNMEKQQPLMAENEKQNIKQYQDALKSLKSEFCKIRDINPNTVEDSDIERILLAYSPHKMATTGECRKHPGQYYLSLYQNVNSGMVRFKEVVAQEVTRKGQEARRDTRKTGSVK